MLAFFDRLDNMPDLQLMAIFVCLIIAAYGLEYIFDRWVNRRWPW